jgi:hypothetical protein
MSRALLILLLAGQISSLLFGQPTGSVQGSVRNEVTGVGIPGVHVVLYTRQATRYETDTDASGAFLVTGVAVGTYQARLEKPGFSPATDQGTAVLKADTNGAIQMNVTMSGSIHVRGRVVDRDGKLVQGSSVRLLGYQAGQNTEGPEFEFKDVRPGYYTLIAMPPLGSKLAATYYPSSIERDGAVRIAVLGDHDLEGFEIRLLETDQFHISGKVLTEEGEPATNARVTLAPMIHTTGTMAGGDTVSVYPGAENIGPVEQEMVAKNGSFTFNNVRKGDWTILATTGMNGDVISVARIKQGSARVGVDRGDVDDVEIRPTGFIQVSGTIEWDGEPPRQAMVNFTPAANPGAFLAGQTGSGNKDGTFKLSLQPGRVFLTPPLFQGYYAASLTMGGQEVLGVPLDIFADPPPIHAVLKRANGVIKGKAESGTSFVMLIPAQTDRLGFGAQVIPALDGTFEMKNVAPGDYTITAFAPPRSLDPAILEKARLLGVRVHVDDSNSPRVELPLVHWLE